jgi:hypothetical protein
MISMFTATGPRAAESARQHGDALLGEGVWPVAAAAATLDRSLPRSLGRLVNGQPEHEVGGKPVPIPPHRFVQTLR